MKTLLLTGASGFIGQYLLKLLQSEIYSNKFRVVVLSAANIKGATTVVHNNYRFTKADFLNHGLEQIDIIIHAGAFTPKNNSAANNIIDCNSNINNTAWLLNNIPSKPEKIIFLSTLDVYENNGEVIDENSKVSPVSLYGWSKLYGEKMLERWGEQNSVVVQILRVGHIYGSGEEQYQKLIPITIARVLNNEQPVIINGGKDKRCFLHVTDCAKAIVSAAELETNKGIINITSAKNFTIRQLVETIIELSKKQLTPVFIENSQPERHLLFNNQKMEQLLHCESVAIIDGLQQEIETMTKFA